MTAKFKLIAAMSLIAVAGVAQAKIPANIQLTPFCDTLNSMSNNAGLVTGMWDSNCDGDAETTMAGTAGKTVQGVLGKGYTMAANTYPLYSVTEAVVVHDDGTWAIYFSDGGLLASGTWTPVVAGVRAAGKAIHAK